MLSPHPCVWKTKYECKNNITVLGMFSKYCPPSRRHHRAHRTAHVWTKERERRASSTLKTSLHSLSIFPDRTGRPPPQIRTLALRKGSSSKTLSKLRMVRHHPPQTPDLPRVKISLAPNVSQDLTRPGLTRACLHAAADIHVSMPKGERSPTN